jgi:hypothetical protein
MRLHEWFAQVEAARAAKWFALVDEARSCDMLAVAAAHGARLSKYSTTGEYVGPCLHCGGDDRFAVNPRKRVFCCRGCHREGGQGAINLEMFLGGTSFVTAVKTLTKTIPLASSKNPATKKVDLSPKGSQDEPERRTTKADVESEKASQRHKAGYLWGLRLPVAGSPVERYLRARGFCGGIPPTIGYLPAHGANPHAMIAAFALPNEVEPGELGDPLTVGAVHLTRLLPDGSDRLRDKQAKIIVGSPSGLPIAVSAINDGLSLAITEGIEDALAYASIGMGAWAAGSAPFLLSLASSVPDYVTTIIIEQHPTNQADKKDAADWMKEGVQAFRQQIDDLIQRVPRVSQSRLQSLLLARRTREGERALQLLIREARSWQTATVTAVA